MLKNSLNSYGLAARIFHWLSSILILSLIIAGFTMTNMQASEQKWEIYGLHKATGVIVLVVVTLRFLWKMINHKVFLPNQLPNLQKKAAEITHFLLYICMFTMPLSGMFMSLMGGKSINFYDLFTINNITNNKEISKILWNIHGYCAYVISFLISIHILAAFYHHFIRKDNILTRMVKG